MEESSKQGRMADRDVYSSCLLVLALLGLGLKIPFVLNVFVQGCLVICTLDVAHRYFRVKNYVMCIIKIASLILIGLFDSVSLTFK